MERDRSRDGVGVGIDIVVNGVVAVRFGKGEVWEERIGYYRYCNAGSS